MYGRDKRSSRAFKIYPAFLPHQFSLVLIPPDPYIVTISFLYPFATVEAGGYCADI